MTRIVWGDSDDRLYEYGIDRGVLYPIGEDGVPWNGLISIDENVVGGESNQYYFDGIKYLDVISYEDYQANLTALSAPPEFASCEGLVALAAGLFATNQPRTRFGLCYRTRIGSASNPKLGYKLHLVYNCTAVPATKSYATQGETVEPGERSWTIESVPADPEDLLIKPTAHLIVDSTKVPNPSDLADLERFLYGDVGYNPMLPSPSGVNTLLT